MKFYEKSMRITPDQINSPLFAKAHTSKSSYVPPQQHREMACFSLIFIDNRDKIIKIYDKTHQTLIIFKGGGAHPDSICLYELLQKGGIPKYPHDLMVFR